MRSPGNTTSICHLLILGSQPGYLLFTSMILLLTWATHFIFIVPFVDSIIPCIKYISVTIFFLNIASLMNTASTDPGIIPPKINPNFIYLEPYMKTSTTFCSICNMYRPARTKHCRSCDHCCQGFDHHCPWIGCCIGVRNYCMFFVFLITSLLGNLLVCMLAIFIIYVWVIAQTSFFNDELFKGIICPVIAVWTFILFISLLSLTCFHIRLIYLRKTTTEYLKQTKAVTNVEVLAQGCRLYKPSLLLPRIGLWENQRVEDVTNLTMSSPDRQKRAITV
jgi:palmitoyltransferase ZDHHC9/14/18